MNKSVSTVRRRQTYPIIAVVLIAIVIAFIYYHIRTLSSFWAVPINAVLFIYVLWMLLSAHMNCTFDSDTGTENLKPIVVIPLYNEDPEMVKNTLDSIIIQTRKPYKVYLIDDCSTEGDYKIIIDSLKKNAEKNGIQIEFYRQDINRGKRQAQAIAFKKHMGDEEVVFVTIDSDTILDRDAIKKGLYPFADKDIMSVAGMLFAHNYKTNLLTRIVSLPFASSFLNGRAAWSAYNSVAVSCGGLAFYRSCVVNEYFDDYTNQIVLGQVAKYGDDRMMTQYASMLGKTVFQETSIAFTLLPENISHLTRQRLRWHRSFWWGGFWVLKNLDAKRMVWWLILSQFISSVVYVVVFIMIVIIYPLINGNIPWEMFVYLMLLSYVRTIRTLSMKRGDISSWKQIISYILISPASSMLNLYIETVLKYVALATLKENSWGTRDKIEVTIEKESA